MILYMENLHPNKTATMIEVDLQVKL